MERMDSRLELYSLTVYEKDSKKIQVATTPVGLFFDRIDRCNIHHNGLSVATMQKPKRKNILIHYEKLMKLLGAETYTALKQNHKMLVEESLGTSGNVRDEEWTKSVAVGSKEFVEDVKTRLNTLANGRTVRQAGAAYQLREPSVSYNGLFGVENDDIGGKNAYF